MSKKDFTGLLINSGRVGSDRTTGMFISPAVLRTAMQEIASGPNDNDIPIDTLVRHMNMRLDYLSAEYEFITHKGVGHLSYKDYNTIEHDFMLFQRLHRTLINTDSSDSSFPEFIRILVNIHLSGQNDEMQRLLTFIHSFITDFHTIYTTIKKKYDSINSQREIYARGNKMTMPEKKALEKTNRFHIPTEELISLLQLLTKFILFFKDNPHFITYGLFVVLDEIVNVRIFSPTESLGGPAIQIPLTPEKLNFNSDFALLQEKYAEIIPSKENPNPIKTDIDKVLNIMNTTYQNTTMDMHIKSKLHSTDADNGIVVIKKESIFYKGVSMNNRTKLEIKESILFYYLGFDPITAASYALSNTTLDEDARTYNSQREFCDESAGFVAEFKILKELTVIDLQNRNIYSIIDGIADTLQDADATQTMKTLIRKILVPSDDGTEMLRISNYDDDYAFLQLLCKATRFDGYIYALNAQGNLSEGLSPEIAVCSPYNKISVLSETSMKTIFSNCSSDLNFVNPYLFDSIN